MPVFWNVTLCRTCKKRRFGRKYRLHYQADKNRRAKNNRRSNVVFLCSVFRLLVTASVVPSLPILVTLMMEGIPSKYTWLGVQIIKFLVE
jgi:hypothetical protein